MTEPCILAIDHYKVGQFFIPIGFIRNCYYDLVDLNWCRYQKTSPIICPEKLMRIGLLYCQCYPVEGGISCVYRGKSIKIAIILFNKVFDQVDYRSVIFRGYFHAVRDDCKTVLFRNPGQR